MSRVETDRETLTTGRVRGVVVRAHAGWVRDYFGERILMRVLSILPPHVAAEANGVVDSGWCSLETLVLLDRAIATVCGDRDGRIPRELGRYAAHVTLAATRRAFAREDIHRFCRCSVITGGVLQDRGNSIHEEVSEGYARITVSHSPGISPVFCLGVAGYYEQAILIHGGREVRVAEVGCQCSGEDACVFDLRWS